MIALIWLRKGLLCHFPLRMYQYQHSSSLRWFSWLICMLWFIGKSTCPSCRVSQNINCVLDRLAMCSLLCPQKLHALSQQAHVASYSASIADLWALVTILTHCLLLDEACAQCILGYPPVSKEHDSACVCVKGSALRTLFPLLCGPSRRYLYIWEHNMYLYSSLSLSL